MKKRLLSLLCALGLAFSCAAAVFPEPIEVFADNTKQSTVVEDPLTFKLKEGHATLVSCRKDYEGAVEIPAEIDGVSVTRIEDYALNECSKVTSVSIPATVTDIGIDALCTPRIPYGEGLFTIFDFSLLTEISVAEDNPAYVSIDGVLFTKDMKLLVQYPSHRHQETYTVPDGVEAIGSSAMFNAQAHKVVLPDSLIFIHHAAFEFAETYYINLPKNLKFIGEHAFYNQGNRILHGIDVIPENIVAIYVNAFYVGCPDTITILNPNCILKGHVFSSIKEYTYTGTIRGYDGSTAQAYAEEYGCTFESLGPAPQLEYIPCGICGENTYWEKTAEDTVRIYGTGRMRHSPIRNSLPSDIEGVTNFVIEEGVTSVLLQGCTSLETVSIPNSVISLENGAFYSSSGLTSITIPENVTAIGNNAFSGCTGLTSITIPNNVTSIGESAFESCSGLKSITIPDNVTSIGESWFKGCSGLTSITIPDNVTAIGNYAFSGCTGLTSITIPNSVTSIGESAFKGCSGLTSITIPDNVTSIGESAFESCSGLKSITIPDGVTNIGCLAFSYCFDLKSVSIPNSATSIGNAFYRTPWLKSKQKTNPLVVVNNILIDGSTCSGDVTIPDNLTSIGDGAFYFSDLTSITIPDGVKRIGDRTFNYCRNLTSITIPDSVTNIGDSAFGRCSGLTSITIPNSVTSIGDSAFEGCSGLTSITIPNSVTSIGDFAFEWCSCLTSITIPDSVTKIGLCAFEWDITINGYTGSYAETYAKENGILFESLGEAPQNTTTTAQTATTAVPVTTNPTTETTPLVTTSAAPVLLRGDVTADGEVSVDDAQLTLKAYTERIAGNDMKLSTEQIKAADVNGDGEISVDDAQNILKYYTEKSVAGKDITWDDILGKKVTTQQRPKTLLTNAS